MLESLGNDAQGQGLYQGNGFVAVHSVAQDSGQCWNFGEPAAVLFVLEFDRQSHVAKAALRRRRNKNGPNREELGPDQPAPRLRSASCVEVSP